MKNAFMIAATGSGCGKTTITCAMLKALTLRGLKVRAFKCGPDYIDPMFHKEIIGIPSKNLDLFFTDEKTTEELFRLDNDSEVSVVEGVMGLYDGMSVDSNNGSSYHLAQALDIPIILVVNAHGMGRSIISVIRGFLDGDEDKRIKGVILNRISAGFYQSVKPIIEDELNIKVVGYFPKDETIAIESRYLGLVLPEEIDDIKGKIEKASVCLEECVNIDYLMEITKVNKEIIKAKDSNGFKVRIAVAKDEAFCFMYEDNLRLLREAGGEVVYFSPIHDESLPENIDGIILYGGYPEKHLEKLSGNTKIIADIKEAIINRGVPSLAECGGFMYLHDKIYDEEGKAFNMCGVINGDCVKTDRLVRFGYITITSGKDSILNKNALINAHEFHYYDSSNNGSDCMSKKPNRNISWESTHIGDNHWWGFAHLYYPSNPQFAKNFVEECYKYSNQVKKNEQ